MNDQLSTAVIKPASVERKHSRLLEDFVRSAKQEKANAQKKDISNGVASSALCNLFQILLERCGYTLIDEAYTHTFWQEVRARMNQYLQSTHGIKGLTKIEEDSRLDEWASKKVAEYGTLIKGPAPLAETRGGFGSSVMKFFR